jgi:hypothetical protein
VNNPFRRQHETFADRQIRLAKEAGAFDGLSGEGQPIRGIDGPADEDWWIKEKLRREQVDLQLPPALEIRQAKRDLLAELSDLVDEGIVRSRIEELNRRIAYVNRTATSGPPSTTTLIDTERYFTSGELAARYRRSYSSSFSALGSETAVPTRPAND